jgi:alkylation response protein AidB-like acyl-CoA dehydrogenase
MRFAFTDEQTAWRDAVRAAHDDKCPPATVRAVWDGDAGAAAPLWRGLAEMGLIGALVPEANDGLGLDEIDIIGCLEESGRAAAPMPLLESAVVAARLLPGTAHAHRLGALAAGDLRVTAVLDGSRLAPWLSFSDVVLVGDGTEVHIVDASEHEAVPGPDRARPIGRVSLGTGSLVTDDPSRIAAARRAAGLGAAAQLLGLTDRMLWMTVEYVRERRQFGVQVGSFQAVRHQLADALRGLELARPLVYAAAWAQAKGRTTADRDVAAARLRAGEVAGAVARTALQCHGAMGYTEEYDLHLWLKRTWALRACWGRADESRKALAAALELA